MPPMPNGKCYLHGGATPHGIASPHYKTGRYSKYLPTQLVSRYRQAIKDPELLSVRDDVGLVDTRLADVLKKLNSAETGQRWKDTQKAFNELRRAMDTKDSVKLASAGVELDALIQGGADEAQAWQEIVMLLEQRRKLVESERKRLVEMQQMITAEQAMLFLNRVVDAVRTHVKDRPTLTAIANEFAAIANLKVLQLIDGDGAESSDSAMPAPVE